MLHWAGGAEGRGVLLVGDTIQVVHDRRWVSFMHSYVNYLPLPASKVRGVARTVAPFAFDRLYSPWPGRVIETKAKAAVLRSVQRYVRAIKD